MFLQLAESWDETDEWETSAGPEKGIFPARLQVCLG